MYENTGPRAHRMAAELIAVGVNVPAVNTRLYEEMPQAKLTLLGIALERVQRFDAGELTLVALDAEDFARAGAEESLSEGIVDHLRSIAATKMAVLIRELTAPESKGKRKVSLRATGQRCRRVRDRTHPGRRWATVARRGFQRRSLWPS